LLSRLDQAYQPEHTVSKSRGYWKVISVLIISLAVLFMILNLAATVRGRTLYLVNGLDRPYV
jgi:hypothetical protein